MIDVTLMVVVGMLACQDDEVDTAIATPQVRMTPRTTAVTTWHDAPIPCSTTQDDTRDGALRANCFTPNTAVSTENTMYLHGKFLYVYLHSKYCCVSPRQIPYVYLSPQQTAVSVLNSRVALDRCRRRLSESACIVRCWYCMHPLSLRSNRALPIDRSIGPCGSVVPCDIFGRICIDR